jgi:hypothetical protein
MGHRRSHSLFAESAILSPNISAEIDLVLAALRTLTKAQSIHYFLCRTKALGVPVLSHTYKNDGVVHASACSSGFVLEYSYPQVKRPLGFGRSATDWLGEHKHVS